MFTLSKDSLEKSGLKCGMVNARAGGFACFEGWVRNHNDGKEVRSLEYEACESLALNEAKIILKEAAEQFGILDAKCVHRIGMLNVGEMAVWVGVTAAHRADAFKACRYIIDEVKKRLPIWKKEHYANGHSGWVGCAHCAAPSPSGEFSEKDYYSKQTVLPEIGQAGQGKLKEHKALVVGAGGLGSPVLMYLSAAGIGVIGICDYDCLEASNLHRQTLYSAKDTGKPKAQLASDRIRSNNPFIKTTIHNLKLNAQNISEVAQDYDIVLDCTDNFEAKFLLNDYCVLNKKPLIQASIYQFDGQIRVYDPASSVACLRCLWPEVPEPGCVGTCAEAGVLGVVPGILGNMQALEALKFILDLPGRLKNETLVFDLTNYRVMKLQENANTACPLCGVNPSITRIGPALYSKGRDVNVDIGVLSEAEIADYKFIDIRESSELLSNPVKIKNNDHIPMSQFVQASPDLKKDQKYLLFCEKGIRSYNLAQKLREEGLVHVYSLTGGTPAIKAYQNAANSSR